MTIPDYNIRTAAFSWLERAVDADDGIIMRSNLERGFEYQGHRVPLVSPQGIFKPRICELPLSITTIPGGPYNDSFNEDGLLSYRYRGTDPDHPDNRGLRQALLDRAPLAYFHGIVSGKYLAVWPVFIVGDEPGQLTFTVAADDYALLKNTQQRIVDDPTPRREYITRAVRQRLHQRGFHERVLKAYRDHCAICRLKHRELLDAAHIIPDGDPDGEPIVTNGLSLCKIHHAAYDRGVLGITPDYAVAIRKDVLLEEDGPMLKHGLVEMHGTRLLLPRSKGDWPDRIRLERRYVSFLDR